MIGGMRENEIDAIDCEEPIKCLNFQYRKLDLSRKRNTVFSFASFDQSSDVQAKQFLRLLDHTSA